MENNSIIYSGTVILLGYLSGTIAGDLKSFVDQLRLQYPKANIPANFVFPIVWGVLYYLYGYFIYKIWKDEKGSFVKFFTIFGLFINYLWTIFFFLNRKISLFIIILQIITVFVIVYGLDKKKDYFLILIQLIYVAWLFFAFTLNWQVL
jgi:tryptophan-rich sensory protein